MSAQELWYEVDPVDVLVDDPDPLHRSRAHTELGRRAVARADVQGARLHFQEALDLDPTDEVPREALQKLEPPPKPLETRFSRFLRTFRR